MSNEFTFYKLRGSAARDNQAVLQMYCSTILASDDGIEAYYAWDDERHKADIRFVFGAVPESSGIRKYREDEVQLLSVIIMVPDTLPDEAELKVTVSNSENKSNKVTIFTCSGMKLKACLGRLNYEITSVGKVNGRLGVNGWVIDRDEVHFDIIARLHMRDEKLKYSCEWVDMDESKDIRALFPECDDILPKGFCLTLKNIRAGMNLHITTGNRESVYRLRGITDYGRNVAFNRFKRYVHRFFFNVNQNGFKVAAGKAFKRIFKMKAHHISDYNIWLKRHMPDIRELDSRRLSVMEQKPQFSVIMRSEMLEGEFYKSLRYQTYSSWEIVAADNICEALMKAKGAYIVFGRMNDILMPDALYEAARHIDGESPDVIYSDEDFFGMPGDGCRNPNFKPDFNIDLLRCSNYIHHVMAVSANLLKKMQPADVESIYDNEYEFIFKCVERADKVCHIPMLLYRNAYDNREDVSDGEAYKQIRSKKDIKAIQGHFERCGIDAQVCESGTEGIYRITYNLKEDSLISIIILNKDHVSDLKRCMDAIDERSDYKNYEYIIVENNSVEPETFEFYREICGRDNVRVLCWDGEFNYSAINNYGAEAANGEYLLLLNNDTEIIARDLLRQMLGCCQREDVGIVGARLYYEDGSIQHGGAVIGLGGIAGHAFSGCAEDAVYQSRTQAMCDYNAVTAACLMVRKSVFEAVGGLDEAFKIAFNDIDFCLRVRACGGLVVYNPNAAMYHYESRSRGAEDTEEKQERFQDEIELFYERWKDILDSGDSYYNPNLTLESTDFSYRW